MNWHLLPIKEIEELLETSRKGLNNKIALERTEEYGKNQLEDKKKKSVFQILLHQLTDFMILILFVAAIISGVLGDSIDTIVIFAIIILNAIIGFIQEYRAEKAMDALKKMAASSARVYREGKVLDIPTIELVPGDLVALEAGNIIPADVRFLETHQLKVDESALTGESLNVEKHPDELTIESSALGDLTNMGFKGTFVSNGRSLSYVVATGMKTELGRIAKLIQSDEIITPLQKRLDSFGKRLSLVILFICILIFGIGWLRGEGILKMLLTSISLAVAAIPEALPALVTIALAFGAKRLVKSKTLVRKLPAVETLGSVTYICTDKTGTLTLNKMTVQELVPFSNKNSDLLFDENDTFLTAMALNHDVTHETNEKWLGDSTEVALAQYASGRNYDRIRMESFYPRISEIPFDSTRKLMTTIHKTNSGFIAITKGAVDILVHRMNANQKSIQADVEAKSNEMAKQGYRVIGYAVRTFDFEPKSLEANLIENDLNLIGILGMIDPAREEVKQAVKECKQAGIIPVMITGDHKLTAQAIARQLGILGSEEDLTLSGPELAALSEEEFASIVEKVRVYARVNPEQKLNIVKVLQSKNQYVAMTGDGVNDAPALKNADIGIAMGINGTEVSKEASHMILLDDNFATIVVAVQHGRRIFDNILKFIKYIMTGNSGELWAILLAPLLGLPIPLLPIHILWVNLVSDGLPGLALASEPAEVNIMNRPPRNPSQNIFTRGLSFHILWVGLLIGLSTIGIQAWSMHFDISHWQTMAFTVLSLTQLGHVMAIRSDKESIFKIGLFSNKSMVFAILITVGLQMMVTYVPFFNIIFKTEPLSLFELGVTFAVSSIVFCAVEIEKWIKRTFIYK